MLQCTPVDLLRPTLRRYRLLFKDPSVRPPIWEEMESDVEHLVSKVAKKYCDQTCVHLQFDNLQGEFRLKAAQLIDKGKLESLPTRAEFFKYFASAINNFGCSFVHKYRFTEKRTGVKPLPRKNAGDPMTAADFESTKNVELSLDDTENGLQIDDPASSSEIGYTEAVSDLKIYLTPFECLVLDQLTDPNDACLFYANMESYLGENKSSSIRVRIKPEHKAEGLGVSLESFNQAVASIQTKFKKFMTDQNGIDEEVAYNKAITNLSAVFEIQVPPYIDRIVVRRMMTIAARVNVDRLSKSSKWPEIVEWLQQVKAVVPSVTGHTVNCYGVLHSDNHRICRACGLRTACKTEAANVGLGEVTLSPKLLGSKLTRIPALVVPDLTEDTPNFVTERDDSVYSFLCETFDHTPSGKEILFFHKRESARERRPSESSGPVFALDEHLRFRFVKPSPELAPELTKIKSNYYLPDDCSTEDSESLINKHAQNTYAKSDK